MHATHQARRRTGLALAGLLLGACASDDSDRSANGASADSDPAPTSTAVEDPPVDDTGSIEYVERPEWGSVFTEAGTSGTFALHEVGTDETAVFDLDRAATERIPASTFKILNTLVILETGVLADVDTVLEWDGVDREVAAWNRDHTLRSGIEVSAVWVFQELARRVGEERMAELVAAAGYGNGDIGGGVDEFWLRGDLRISPLGQIEFLRDLVAGDLPFSEANLDATREIIVRERGDDWTWSHKTGTALAEEPDLGWLVGTTEHDGSTWVFAMNVDLEVVDDVVTEIDPAVRQEIARSILVLEGALPPG